MTRGTWVVLAVCGLGGLGGCKKEAAKDTPAPAVAPAPAAAPAVAAALGALRPASITDAHVAAADKVVVAAEVLGPAVTAAGADCAKVAAVLGENGEALKAAKVELEALQVGAEPAAVTWFKLTYETRLLAAYAPLVTAMATCARDAAFVSAAAGLDLTGRSLDAMGRDADQAGRDADKAGRDADKAGRDADKAGRNADKMGRDLDKMGKALDKLGK